MTDRDAFAVLGLERTASLDEVRVARRRLALELHPDRASGNPDAERRMQEVNAAFDAAVKAIRSERDAPRSNPETDVPITQVRRVVRMSTDVASFSIDCLRPEAFERLFVVSHWAGEPLHADPPGLLEVHLHEPRPCFCRLELLPEAGGTMVSLSVGAIEGAGVGPPDLDAVRDLFVLMVNQLGAEDFERET